METVTNHIHRRATGPKNPQGRIEDLEHPNRQLDRWGIMSVKLSSNLGLLFEKHLPPFSEASSIIDSHSVHVHVLYLALQQRLGRDRTGHRPHKVSPRPSKTTTLILAIDKTERLSRIPRYLTSSSTDLPRTCKTMATSRTNELSISSSRIYASRKRPSSCRCVQHF